MSFFKRLDDDDFEDENGNEDLLQDFRFEWKGKVYTDVNTLRKELSTSDLQILLTTYDCEIAKTERKLKFGNGINTALRVLFFAGVGALLFKSGMSGIIKNIANVFAPVSIATGILGKIHNFRKYKSVEENLDYLCAVYDEIEEELDIRGAETHFRSQDAEIFSDVFAKKEGEENIL